MKKSEIDDLVRGIGLEPVVQQQSTTTKPSTKKTKAFVNNANSDPSNQHDVEEKESPSVSSILQSSPSISLETQLQYSRYGHAVLRSYLPPSIVQTLRSELLPHVASRAILAWRQKVEVQLSNSADNYHRENAQSIVQNLASVEECQEMLESLGVDPLGGDLPFLQHFNSWRAADNNDDKDNDNNKSSSALTTVRKLCLSSYLAQTASILLDTPTVRLYQDSLFHKRAGIDGWTPWHSDARMAPFDTSRMITFWIPLQYVPKQEEGGTGLLFADGSHCDFALPYWNGVDGAEYDRLEQRYEGVSHHMPLDLGDVTVHNGWTLHCADAADVDAVEDRYAFSVTYVDGRAEVREGALSLLETDKGDNEDVWSFRSWVEEVEPRTEFRHRMVPVVWPSEQRDDLE